jgi:hypothetical protein
MENSRVENHSGCRFVNEELRDRWKMEVADLTFEDMIDQLEKSSGGLTIF